MNKIKYSVFRKVDLHIHTSKSACYSSDPSVDPEQIVESALAAELEAIAITDHNTVEAVSDIREIGREEGLLVFPGIELSTDGGHILALFELDTPVERLRKFLDYLGIFWEGWGDAATVAEGKTEEVLEKIQERGGLAIAAHIERWPSGFLQTNQPRRVKMAIHGSKYLDALEITIPQNKGQWKDGRVRNYPKKYACIQGSDAHALEDIGRRPVYIQAEKFNLDALRSAFLHHEARIKFPDELHLS